MALLKYNNGELINGVLLIKRIPGSKYSKAIFECPYCKKEYETRISHVLSGGSSSCGCMFNGKPKHYQTTLAGYRGPEYGSWDSMKHRCYGNDKDHAKYYRDKSVVICEGFMVFQNFRDMMGDKPSPGHTVDRIKGDLNYSCGKCSECLQKGWEFNCRWATKIEQSRNLSNNLIVTYKDETKTLQEWCEELNLSYSRMRDRIFLKGIKPEVAFTLKRRDPSLVSKMKQTVWVEYNGEKKSLAEWTAQLGLDYTLMRNRIRKLKWSVEDAFTIPAFDRKEGGRINKSIYKSAYKPESNFIAHSFGVMN